MAKGRNRNADQALRQEVKQAVQQEIAPAKHELSTVTTKIEEAYSWQGPMPHHQGHLGLLFYTARRETTDQPLLNGHEHRDNGNAREHAGAHDPIPDRVLAVKEGP